MALTLIKTAAIENDAVTAGKIPANAVGSSEIANDAVDTAQIADDAVTQAQVAGASIDEAKMNISNAGTNGQYLQKQSGNTGGLTWADVPAGVGGATGVDFNDDVKIRLGTGNDFEIYHDGSNSFIKGSGTGNLAIQSNGTSSVILQPVAGENSVVGNSNGSVDLYYDNSKKFETVTGGVTITGNLEPEADNTRDLGSSSKRWANVYVGDMQLSNEGATNDVDGTWGSYTLQEGADDLFLINNRTGKKYKFKITEVS